MEASSHVSSTPSPTDPFAPLSQDVSGLLYGFLPVRDLLSFATTSQPLRNNVAHQQHWFDLCARRWPGLRSSLDASSSPSKQGEDALNHASSLPSTRAYTDADDATATCFRSTFLQHAEAEMNWRRARPVQTTQERLVLRDEDTGEVASGPVTSLVLSKTDGREVMLAAMGRHVGLFRADASGKISVSKGPQLVMNALRKTPGNLDNGSINNMKLAPGAPTKLAVAGNDDSLRVIDLTTGLEHMWIKHHAASVWGLSLDTGSNSWDPFELGSSSDSEDDDSSSSSGSRSNSSGGGGGGGNLMMASSSYGWVDLYDVDRGSYKESIKFQAHSSSWIRALHLDMSRYLLISGSADSTCKAWDLRRPGEVLMRYVHPNHFEEIRSVECVGNRLFTGCYDGMVREFALDSGELKGMVANHCLYAVECLSLSRETGRMVSVDWAGVLAVGKGRPLIDLSPEVSKEDTRVLVNGARPEEGWMEESGLGSNLNSFVSGGRGNNLYLRPNFSGEATRGPGGRIRCDLLGPAIERKEDMESSLSATVICMQHNEERLVMGTKSGDIVSLVFRKGLCDDL